MECTRWGGRHILVTLWNKLVYHWKLDSRCVARVPETGQDILHYLLCLPGPYLIKRELTSRRKHGLMIPVFHSTFVMIRGNSSNISLWKQCLSWKISQARLLFTHSSNFGISLHFPKQHYKKCHCLCGCMQIINCFNTMAFKSHHCHSWTGQK